ncbi:hypothetical protein [Paracoccus homiensis]|uniref:Uncharacterized protein n=1 Tax=Paracoccus homiensis TaxID=364199 RepID=A0A1I0IZ17_9RHOB|nr:hypothetical protein [Paracoccus homiensis]SEU02611.1 hypothetical protein SAMN04489858_12026 [Paracoccus homiensis]
MIARILQRMGDWLANASDPFADRMDAQHIESRIIAGIQDPVRQARLAADKTTDRGASIALHRAADELEAARNAIAQMKRRDRAGDAHIAGVRDLPDVEGE